MDDMKLRWDETFLIIKMRSHEMTGAKIREAERK